MTTFKTGNKRLTFGSSLLSVPKNRKFMFKINTNLPGSNSDTFIIPTSGVGYDFTIDWGDSNIENISGTAPITSHIYSIPGNYIIKITGTFPQIYFNNTGDKAKITKIMNFGEVGWTSMEGAFYGCNNIENIFGFGDFSNVTSFKEMFRGCLSLIKLDNIETWNTSNVTSTNAMFGNCTSLTTLDLNKWDMSKVTDPYAMFADSTLSSVSVGNWDTSSFELMDHMFRGTKITELDVTNWNTSNVTSIYVTFYNSLLNSLNVTNWDISKVTNLQFTFYGTPITTLDISGWDVSKVTNMKWFLYGANNWIDSQYDAALIAWASLPILESNVEASFGDAKYSSGAAAIARQYIIDTYGWTLYDGGEVI